MTTLLPQVPAAGADHSLDAKACLTQLVGGGQPLLAQVRRLRTVAKSRKRTGHESCFASGMEHESVWRTELDHRHHLSTGNGSGPGHESTDTHDRPVWIRNQCLTMTSSCRFPSNCAWLRSSCSRHLRSHRSRQPREFVSEQRCTCARSLSLFPS